MPVLSHVEDPRAPWERFRRKQLERICKAEGLNVDEGEPAMIYREKLGRANVNVMKYAYLINGGPLHGNESPRQENRTDGIQPAIIVKEAVKAEPGKVSIDLDFLTRPQLMQLCAKQGIEVVNTDKKEDLMRKLGG